jgi:hypothetical protein
VTKKKSLGRDPFEDPKVNAGSGSVEKLIRGKGLQPGPGTKEVLVNVKLTPSDLKHLDAIRSRLAAGGRGAFSRNELIRIAITLLSEEDI